MYDIEIVAVVPNTRDGEARRVLATADTMESAVSDADRLTRELIGRTTLLTHVVTTRTRGDSVAVAYTDGLHYIVGYANIAKVLDDS